MNPPELMDDLVDEILLRLPPDEPACLARASAVCKRWRRLLSDRAFLLRRRRRAPPPLLGFLHNLDDADHPDRFVPTTALPIPPPPPELHCGMALDCRHGCALLDAYPSRIDLVVWHPMTGHLLRRLPRPDVPYLFYYNAAVLCAAAAAGCDHLDCHEGPFRVVVVGTEEDNEAWATVYSSESDEWSPPTSARLARGPEFCVEGPPPSSEIRSTSPSFGIGVVKFDMKRHRLSLIDPPAELDDGFVLMPLDNDGVLGLAAVEDHSLLSVWSMDVSLDHGHGVANWEKCRVIELDSLLPNLDHSTPVLPIGFVEGANIIFLRTDAGVFTLELRSMRVTKVCKNGFFYAVVPYTSFYIPGVHLQQQHSGPQISNGRAWGSQAANMRRGSSEQPRERAPLHQQRRAGRPVNSQRPTGDMVRSSGRASRLASQDCSVLTHVLVDHYSDRCTCRVKAVTSTAMNREPVSSSLKSRSIWTPMIQATSTLSGTCNPIMIWQFVQPDESRTTTGSVLGETTLIVCMGCTFLFLSAKMMAPACSAALPTMGRRMMLMKLTERPHDCEVGSMVPTTYSERTEMTAVMRASQKSALANPSAGSSSSSPASPPSTSCGSNSWRCHDEAAGAGEVEGRRGRGGGDGVLAGGDGVAEEERGGVAEDGEEEEGGADVGLVAVGWRAPRLTTPPQKREVPRTRRRLERTEPSREHLTTSIFPLSSANSAMISSVAFPHVAFSSPPTAPHAYTIINTPQQQVQLLHIQCLGCVW
uniref:F-box domain-containing protein n=1 Tax=Oryza nivara TaxID=4536 RepID=A0A0E0FN51_ORYNI